eukprot:TRINITY_DN3157_c1_g1_i1.p1 TRINITY_DN3157_c1_g1~~TRINITY_DN3157_c1_g1_i1.p1  ORF type:complete len:785 (+),score=183.35 TRINITY_DN3157_c1_g1_i1:67-2421(+)
MNTAASEILTGVLQRMKQLPTTALQTGGDIVHSMRSQKKDGPPIEVRDMTKDSGPREAREEEEEEEEEEESPVNVTDLEPVDEEGVLVSKWEDEPNENWLRTEYEDFGARVYEMNRLLKENIEHFSGKDIVDITEVMTSLLTNWDVFEEAALRVAQAAPRHDADPESPGNGYRSVLHVSDVCVSKILTRLRDCQTKRAQLLFNTQPYVADLQDYSAILHTLRKMMQYAVLTNSVNNRQHLFMPESEAELESQTIADFQQFDCSCFYGRRVAYYYDARIRNAFRLIISAMVGYGVGFHDTPEENHPLNNGALALMKGVGCLLSPEQRAEGVIARFRSCDIPFAKGFWGLTDSAPLAQHTGSLVSPWMSVNKEIKIPITEDVLLECFDSNDLVHNLLKLSINTPLEQMDNVEQLIKENITNENLSEVEIQQFNNIMSKRKGVETTISDVPPLATPIPKPSAKAATAAKSAAEKITQLTKMAFNVGEARHLADLRLGHVTTQLLAHSDEPCGTRGGVLIHIHGGGFVAQSPKSHEVYLRHWAKILKVPILSVDYSLAPEAWFPRAVDECFAVYMWVVRNRHLVGAGSKGRIILTGDSAGGNLAMAVCLKAVMKGVRVPDGVVCSYPVLNVKLAASPSRLLALMDTLLPLGLLECCLEAYTGKREKVNHPLLSPMTAKDELLKGLPPVRIVASGLDPLLDDSVVFIRRLKSLGLDAEMRVISTMPHGFLNLAYLGGGPDSLKANHVVASYLTSLLAPNASHDDIPEQVVISTETGTLRASEDAHFNAW